MVDLAIEEPPAAHDAVEEDDRPALPPIPDVQRDPFDGNPARHGTASPHVAVLGASAGTSETGPTAPAAAAERRNLPLLTSVMRMTTPMPAQPSAIQGTELNGAGTL